MTDYRYQLVNRVGDEADYRDRAFVVTSQVIVAEFPPELAISKGFWARVTDQAPDIDPRWQRRSGPTWSTAEPVIEAGDLIAYGTLTAEYVVEDLPIETVLERRLAELASYRWDKEVAGKLWNGIRLDSTDRGKGLLHGAVTRLERRPPGTITRWKIGLPEIEAPIDLETAGAAFDVVSDYVDALFAAELDHITAMVALGDDPEAVGTYDFTTGWPSAE